MGSWEEGWREGAAGGLKPGPASPFQGLPGSYHIPPWGLGLEGKGQCSAFPVIPTPSADLPAQMYLCTLFTTQLPGKASLATEAQECLCSYLLLEGRSRHRLVTSSATS